MSAAQSAEIFQGQKNPQTQTNITFYTPQNVGFKLKTLMTRYKRVVQNYHFPSFNPKDEISRKFFKIICHSDKCIHFMPTIHNILRDIIFQVNFSIPNTLLCLALKLNKVRNKFSGHKIHCHYLLI